MIPQSWPLFAIVCWPHLNEWSRCAVVGWIPSADTDDRGAFDPVVARLGGEVEYCTQVADPDNGDTHHHLFASEREMEEALDRVLEDHRRAAEARRRRTSEGEQ